MGRGDLSDEEWGLVGPLLPSERGRWARPAGDNRRFLNGMLHVLRIGCPWRDMHERYGKWNSVYVRFRRWAEQGVWDALLQTLLVDHAAALRAKSTPAVKIKDSLSALSRPVARHRIIPLPTT